MIFKNRKSDFPNRRVIRPVAGQENVYEIERANAEGVVEEEGTLLNSEMLTNWSNQVEEDTSIAKSNADQAITTADSANIKSGEALTKANTANSAAQNALTNSQNALAKAINVESQFETVKQNNPTTILSSTILNIDWTAVDWTLFDAVWGSSSWNNVLGTYTCRGNSNASTADWGFSGSYSVKFEVWLSNYIKITLSDTDGSINFVEANTGITRGTTLNLKNAFAYSYTSRNKPAATDVNAVPLYQNETRISGNIGGSANTKICLGEFTILTDTVIVVECQQGYGSETTTTSTKVILDITWGGSQANFRGAFAVGRASNKIKYSWTQSSNLLKIYFDGGQYQKYFIDVKYVATSISVANQYTFLSALPADATNTPNDSINTSNGTVSVKGSEVYHPGNKPTPAALGAVAKAGDTMTDGLKINTGSGNITLDDGAVFLDRPLTSGGGYARGITQRSVDGTTEEGGLMWYGVGNNPPDVYSFGRKGNGTIYTPQYGIILDKDNVLKARCSKFMINDVEPYSPNNPPYELVFSGGAGATYNITPGYKYMITSTSISASFTINHAYDYEFSGLYAEFTCLKPSNQDFEAAYLKGILVSTSGAVSFLNHMAPAPVSIKLFGIRPNFSLPSTIKNIIDARRSPQSDLVVCYSKLITPQEYEKYS